MKKNIIKSIMVAVFAIFAGYNVYLANANNNILTDTMLANVEALAQSEETYYENRYPLTVICGAFISEGIIWDTTCTKTVITCQGGGYGCSPLPCLVHQRN